jgi:hypothetical protein
MTKPTQHSAYQIFEDALLLAGSFVKLGKTLATNKIQSTADAATTFIHTKVEMPDLSAQLSGATETFENVSDYALHTDVKHMVDDVGAFARKHPVAALISVVAIGAMFSRLMRAEPAPKPATTKIVKNSKPKAKIAKDVAKPRRKANGAAQAHA